MTTVRTDPSEQFTMLCVRCERPVRTPREWIGREVQCPHCNCVVCVPEDPQEGRPPVSKGPNLSPKRAFNFACPGCGCLLEGHTGICGRHANCPTCGSRFVAPYLSPSGMPDKAVPLETEQQTATPLHAYAASGDQAPKFVQQDGGTFILCPRCDRLSQIDADACIECGVPFTLEGAQTMQKLAARSAGKLALTFAVLSIPLCPVFVPAIVAAWFGIKTVHGAQPGSEKLTGTIALTIAVLSIVSGALYWLLA